MKYKSLEAQRNAAKRARRDKKLLGLLEQGIGISEAARRVGISRQHAYIINKRAGEENEAASKGATGA